MGLFRSFKKKNNHDDSSGTTDDNQQDLQEENEAEVIDVRVREAEIENEISSEEEVYEDSNEEEEDDDVVVVEKKSSNNVEDVSPVKQNQNNNSRNDVLSSLTGNNKNNKILTVINQKGGVGKSTTAINLGAALADNNKKVLVVDLDPQGNTTSGLGIEKNNLKQCVYDVLLNDVSIQNIMVKNAYKTLDVVPSTINLAGAEVELVNEIARENRLKDAIDSVKDNYDYIFIDCPPSLGLLTVNALVAADKLLIPIQTEFYALEGVTKLLDSMKRVKMRLNKNLEIFGVLLTMFDGRTTLAKQVSDEVRKFFKDLVFDVKIPRTVKISEAPSFGQPITQYEPTCKGAIAYNKLAKEVIERG